MKFKGVLITDIDGTKLIRQYTKDGEFIDYKINNSSLIIEVNDKTATTRVDEDGQHWIEELI
jgi:very-short-patch-repair endonuclease